MEPNNDSSSSVPGQLPKPVSPTASTQPTNDEEQTDSDASVSANAFDHPISTKHLEADDLDLIEKEWVTKAKQVVDKTQGDPYEQSNEINKIKADYIKKRYNRAIKLK